jgi:iron uptake system component EfeO
LLSSRVLRAAVTAAFAAVPTVAVGACGDSDDASPGSAKKVAIRLTDAGCEPATLELGAGSTAFEVTNAGTGRVTEFELLDGARVLGEKEHLAQGTTGGFVLTLQPGSYTPVSTQQRRRFSQLVDALAEPLSRVAAKLQG